MESNTLVSLLFLIQEEYSWIKSWNFLRNDQEDDFTDDDLLLFMIFMFCDF